MSLVNFLPKICQTFPKVTTALIHFGFILVNIYHLFSSSVLFNTAFDDAKGLEKVADCVLSPVQYLCGAKVASYDDETGRYKLNLRFDYSQGKKIYSPLALYLFTPSLTLGGVLKGASLLMPTVLTKHRTLKGELSSTEVLSCNEYYRSIGLAINDFSEEECLDSFHYDRREEDLNHLHIDKEGLKAIAAILHHHSIPFWVDCGTLLGTYCYGGVIPWDYDIDIGIIANDFDNVMHALNGLDPDQYSVQDWSSRGRPHSYIRVYIKENHHHIDIFHYALDPNLKTLTFILSYEDSAFMAEDWKMREKAHVQPMPFDMVFPLKKGQFDGLEVPMPCDAENYLKLMYNSNLKPNKLYNPKTNQYEKDLSHPYWKLPLTR